MTTEPFRRRLPLLLLSAALVLPLAACQSTSEASQQARIDNAIASAASQASANGESGDSLPLLERLYKRDSGNQDNALKYATALQNSGRLNRADLVLSPFAVKKNQDNAGVLTEYAAIKTAMGDYPAGENYARRAVGIDGKNGQAWHVLGIALDAQQNHAQAEIAFRKAIENWSGNQATVLNDLGLNLASQGFVDDALDTLRKAQSLDPNRTEIERNIRIVTALQVAHTSTPRREPSTDGVPIPERKPERS
jgi:Flp pilus assembly protein TadD